MTALPNFPAIPTKGMISNHTAEIMSERKCEATLKRLRIKYAPQFSTLKTIGQDK